MVYFIATVFPVVMAGFVIFVNHYPAFGNRPTRESLERIQRAPNYSGDKFTNLYPTKETFGWEDYKELFAQWWKGNPHRRPTRQLPYRGWKREELASFDTSGTTAMWFGHSAFYLNMNGKHILLDPMFGEYPSPVPYMVNRRFNETLPVDVDDLPEIDVVVLSHDHYDHLDHGSILRLKDKTKLFLVPLGVGAHLEAWGVKKNRIRELYWYEDVVVDGITFTCTPAQHFSGRGLTDKMQTLWCSWVIRGDHNIYFSGDSGYFPEFKKIGEQYGPFDACFLECGQYNPLWKDIHMFPEETAQAHLDLKGKTLIPIHWGAFSLGLHNWNEPVERLRTACVANSIELATPVIGEPIRIGEKQSFPMWWKSID